MFQTFRNIINNKMPSTRFSFSFSIFPFKVKHTFKNVDFVDRLDRSAKSSEKYYMVFHSIENHFSILSIEN